MFRKTSTVVTTLVLLSVFLGNFLGQSARADTPILSYRFDEMSDSTPSVNTTHLIGFTIGDTTEPLGSIEFQFCSNDPLPNEPCTAPDGLDVSAASIYSESGNTGFAVSPLTTANDIILTHSPAIPEPVAGGPNTYRLSNIINPSTPGTYYIRVYIYPTTDASGIATEAGGIAIAIGYLFQVNSIVPPYLLFCAAVVIYNNDCSTASTYLIDEGSFTDTRTAIATSQMLVATNAQTGYSISVNGTTLTSGNNIISALSTPSPSIIGTNQFGMNLRANNLPTVGNDPTGLSIPIIASDYNTPNRFTFNNNSTLSTSNGPSNYVTYTASYVTNVSLNQSPGVYTTTLNYICLANF